MKVWQFHRTVSLKLYAQQLHVKPPPHFTYRPTSYLYVSGSVLRLCDSLSIITSPLFSQRSVALKGVSIDALMVTAYRTHKDVMATMIVGITLMKTVKAQVFTLPFSPDHKYIFSVRSGSGSSDTGVAVGVSLLILICCCLCCCGGIGGLSSKGSTTTTTVHPVPSRIVRVIAVTDD